MEAEFPNNPLFVITRVYRGTVFVENDLSNETSKPFGSMDEFCQVHKGKGDIKKKSKAETLEKWGADLSDEAVKINVLPAEREPPQGGQCY